MGGRTDCRDMAREKLNKAIWRHAKVAAWSDELNEAGTGHGGGSPLETGGLIRCSGSHKILHGVEEFPPLVAEMT